MDTSISRSEIKRRFKRVEDLVLELLNLAAKDLKALPCEDSLRQEIIRAGKLKAGARKRQIKHIAKILRQNEISGELLDFLEQRKGSRLKETNEFHELERLRDVIIDEAIAFHDEYLASGREIDLFGWHSMAVDQVALDVPGLDKDALRRSALDFARNRKTTHKREIFRQLKAGFERQRFAENKGE